MAIYNVNISDQQTQIEVTSRSTPSRCAASCLTALRCAERLHSLHQGWMDMRVPLETMPKFYHHRKHQTCAL